MELWCHTVDALLAKGATFADALDGANVILQAHRRQMDLEQAAAAGPIEGEHKASPHESGTHLIASLIRTGTD
jgi:hypothetical protein